MTLKVEGLGMTRRFAQEDTRLETRDDTALETPRGIMRDPVVTLLAELVGIDSVNPVLVPGGAGESSIARFAAARLRGAGLDVEIVEAAPDRPNVVGVLEGRRPGRSLMLCGH